MRKAGSISTNPGVLSGGSFVPDDVVDLLQTDHLNTVQYARALMAAIEKPHKGSMVIGLFGTWGCGKSSIVRTVKSLLDPKSYFFVTYDAWKYAGDSFRRTFLLEAQDALSVRDKQLREILYHGEARDIKARLSIDLKTLVFILGSIVVMTLAALFFFPSWLQQTSASGGLALIISCAALVISGIRASTTTSRIQLQRPRMFAPEQFEAAFEDIVEIAKKKRKTMVVVVDNIDRCKQDVAFELLAAIKGFLCDHTHVLFVLPVDDSALKDHIRNATGNDSVEADEYLRKLFNITLQIKPFSRLDMYDFCSKLRGKYGLPFSNTTLDIIAKHASSPRRVIQTFNNLIVELAIVKARFGDEFAACNESVAVILMIIREDWPALYSRLVLHPHLVRALEFPEGLQPEARRFLVDTRAVLGAIDDQTLDRLLSNMDNFREIPDRVIEALRNRDIDAVSQYASESAEQYDAILKFLFDDIRKGIDRGLYKTSVKNRVEMVLQLNNRQRISPDQNRILQAELEPHLSDIIESLGEGALLAHYIHCLSEDGLYYLMEHTLSQLPARFPADAEPATGFWRDLVLGITSWSEDASVLSAISKPFQLIYANSEITLEEMNLSSGVMQSLISAELIAYVIQNLFPNLENWALDEMVILSKAGVLSEESVGLLYERMADEFGEMTDSDEDTILNVTRALNKIFAEHEGVENETVIEQISNRFQAIVAAFDIVASSDTEGIAEAFVRHIGIFYRITRGSLRGIQHTLNQLYDLDDEAKKLVRKELNDLLDRGLHCRAWHSTVIADPDVLSPELLEVYSKIFALRSADGYRVPDKEVQTKIQEIVSAIDQENIDNDLRSSVAEWLTIQAKHDRVRYAIIFVVTKLDKEALLALPKSLQEFAFDHVAKNIFDYEECTELMQAMLAKANYSYDRAVVNVATAFLQNQQTWETGLLLAESFKRYTKTIARKLTVAIEEEIVSDDTYKERAEAILAQLRETLEEPS